MKVLRQDKKGFVNIDRVETVYSTKLQNGDYEIRAGDIQGRTAAKLGTYKSEKIAKLVLMEMLQIGEHATFGMPGRSYGTKEVEE